MAKSFDFFQFLLGTWKRNMEWHEFGGSFGLLKTTNMLCKVEEYYKLDAEPGEKYGTGF